MSSKVQSLLHTNSPSRYQIVLLISVVTGSWAAIFARIAQHENVPTIVIVAFRLTVGALVLTPFVMRRYRDQLYRLRRKDILFTAFAGFWFAIHLTSGFASLEHTSVLVSSVVGGTIPLWIALLEVFFLKARLNQTMWLGLGVTLVGGIIIALAGSHDTSLGNNPMLGSLLSLMAAGAGAVYAIGGRSSRERVAFLPYVWMVFGFAAITECIIVLIARAPVVGYSGKAYLAMIMITILPQLFGHITYNYALRHLPATYCSVVGQLGIIIGAVLAFLFFHEVPNALQLPGSAAILMGIGLVNLGQMRSNKPLVPEPMIHAVGD